MNSDWRRNAPVFLAGAASVTTVVSNVASEILLVLALITLLANHVTWKWPPFTVAIAVWMGWTVLSLLASGHVHEGLKQIKTFFWFLMLFVVYNALRAIGDIRNVVLGWAVAASVSSIWGFVQYIRKYISTPKDFETAYDNDRITGFTGHWMILSGLLMMALLMFGAMWLFSKDRRHAIWLMVAGALTSAALLLTHTRSIWAGAAVGAAWLLWNRKRWLVALLPVFAALILLIDPLNVRERAMLVLHPQEGALDVSAHRGTLRRVGWEMIKAHPLLGVGPEQVGPQFLDYIPPDLPRSIPKEWYHEHLHNIYFHYAAERGVPALMALMWFLVGSFFILVRTAWRLPKDSEALWVLHGAAAVIIGTMVFGYWEVNLHGQVLGMFLSAVACGFVVSEQKTASERRA